MTEWIVANIVGLAIGYCLCVLVPIPFVESYIRKWWGAAWYWLWDNTVGALVRKL